MCVCVCADIGVSVGATYVNVCRVCILCKSVSYMHTVCMGNESVMLSVGGVYVRACRICILHGDRD